MTSSYFTVFFTLVRKVLPLVVVVLIVATLFLLFWRKRDE